MSKSLFFIRAWGRWTCKYRDVNQNKHQINNQTKWIKFWLKYAQNNTKTAWEAGWKDADQNNNRGKQNDFYDFWVFTRYNQRTSSTSLYNNSILKLSDNGISTQYLEQTEHFFEPNPKWTHYKNFHKWNWNKSRFFTVFSSDWSDVLRKELL